MPRTIAWTDGTTWTADEGTFRRVTERLDALRPVIWGLDPIYERWLKLAAQRDRLDVDDFAPSEDDRAVLTAALERATEDAQAMSTAELGFDDAAARAAFLERLAALHELFVTDVTQELPRARRR
jgi:hypothetical protein